MEVAEVLVGVFGPVDGGQRDPFRCMLSPSAGHELQGTQTWIAQTGCHSTVHVCGNVYTKAV